MRYNQFNQPIGDELKDYEPGSYPDVTVLEGKTVRIEKLSMKHASDLYEFYGPNGNPKDFTYLFVDGPLNSFEAMEELIRERMDSKDFYFLTIIDKATEKAVGSFSLMRIDLSNRVVEMGNVHYSEKLKKSRQGTEAQFLVMQYVFEVMKYRRYEWKCDDLNAPSRNAALRLGFTFEGIFRKAVVYKGRTRDTAWFSIIDSEWEDKKRRLLTWLSDDNFDENGKQKQSLKDIK
ncbi:GCN5-related N-acetyltransferase [Neocallimastix lanati (nom. inval.)]|jgi:RimJ/RimL family protein N-acetyltransferase|nr:GCN5-related N-acetyltransferase [Neocallimastix sp. JGI-2020a]